MIEDFETKYNQKITTENIDYTTVENFRQYVLYDRDNRNDTAYKTLASLKCVLRWLIKNGYKIDPESTNVRQKIRSKYDIVTLSEAEIMKIKSVKLPLFKQKYGIVSFFRFTLAKDILICNSYLPIKL